MVTARRAQKPAAAPRRVVEELPILQNGDRLTAGEFLRRFGAMPEVKKAELIDGIVYMVSPVRAKQHGVPDHLLQGWLFSYTASTPGTMASSNSTVRFDADNVPQPDVLLMINEKNGGQARIGADGYIHGAPELVVEIAASSAALDLHGKLDSYRRAGVKEFVVWRPTEKVLDWFVLEDGNFIALKPAVDGSFSSRCFPGLVLDVKALVDEDPGRLRARVDKSCGKPAHRAWVQKLLGK